MGGQGTCRMVSGGASVASRQRLRGTSAAAAMRIETSTEARAASRHGRIGRRAAGGAACACRPGRTGSRRMCDQVRGREEAARRAAGSAARARRSRPRSAAAAPPILLGARLRIRRGCGGRAKPAIAAPGPCHRHPGCSPAARPRSKGSAMPPGPAPARDQRLTEGRAAW